MGFSIWQEKNANVNPKQQLQVQKGEQLSVSLCSCWLLNFEISAFALALAVYAASEQGTQESQSTRDAIMKAHNFIGGKITELLRKMDVQRVLNKPCSCILYEISWFRNISTRN